MLTDLTIKNLAIIDSLHVGFTSGLNILTGETGAGKSIIIDAVNLLLGSRAGVDLIRSGTDEAAVEAIFDVSSLEDLRLELASRGIDCDGELLVRRVISRSGKGRVFVNGSMATVAILGDISRRLINIYGQHESQTLLKVENHLEMLDGFAGLFDLRREFAGVFRSYRKVEEQLRLLDQDERDALRRADVLAFQVEEISAAALVPGEEEQLEHEKGILANGEKLLARTGEAYDTLYGGERSLLGSLRGVEQSVSEAARFDESLTPLTESISAAYAQLEDAALSLRDYAARLDSDPERIQAVDDRLELIRRLKRKYGESVEEILTTHAEMAVELEGLQGREKSRESLEAERESLLAELRRMGDELGARREAAATRLQSSLEHELHQLSMKHARIEVRIEPLAEARESGFQRVELLFSPNPGEPPKPLAKIASGGELSRIMLALKQLHPESDVPTLIFDEVDTGIGGATSAMVGKKLGAVAARQQVLCITHLPQVAAHAGSHYKVEKHVIGERTSTSITRLDQDGRVEEVARMLGALVITEKSREHARELLQQAAAH